MESLFAQMWRKNTPDPYGASELKKVVSEVIWGRLYISGCRRQYPELVHSRNDATLVAQRLLESPLDFFMKAESPERDATWVQSLPNEALRCFMKHALDLAQGFIGQRSRGGACRCQARRSSALTSFTKPLVSTSVLPPRSESLIPR